ncbi:MAG: hypothetical protein KDL87_16905, partial [Verrucomicrobiae bacterium]|nr:hypothetical protein [Verrucomicrobiae bacterium]
MDRARRGRPCARHDRPIDLLRLQFVAASIDAATNCFPESSRVQFHHCAMSQNPLAEHNRYDVIVIGAGHAG